MTTTPINRDDTGINALKSSNTQPAASEPTEEVMPYPMIHPEGSREGRSRRPQQHRRRTRSDRRQEDRRKKQVAVLLDTRLPYERRVRSRRNADKTKQKRTINTRKGISYYI
ncbi:MAG: hypothetical protein OEW89_10990 [Gammaproteobacteria bacterium]|nr:hypothetical protein [Gammaproteobacteria bacterium]MDH5593904.1 hypothetical protein [Gammaproteobacteria bacterium]MDH5614712.1 hypothetical protein [Gammaproteobacteria bacterium]